MTVHTTGVNWQSIGVIAAIVGIAFTFLMWQISRRDHKREVEATNREAQAAARNEEVKAEITGAVNHLSDVLMARLETKEAVAQISVRLARIEGAMGTAEHGTTRE